jgi:hypothetical protein
MPIVKLRVSLCQAGVMQWNNHLTIRPSGLCVAIGQDKKCECVVDVLSIVFVTSAGLQG